MNARVSDNRVGTIRSYLNDMLLARYDASEADQIVRRLFSDLLNFDHSRLVLDAQQPISESELLRLHFAAKRIAAGEPTQYVLGHATFMRWNFEVRPGVLIPRPETEELVDWISTHRREEQLRVLEVGVGSGCVCIALKKLHPTWQITGIDISTLALDVARKNASALNADVNLEHADVFQFTRWDEWDVIVSNPPYIHPNEKMDMAEHVIGHEPHEALFVTGDDPLLFYKHMLSACAMSQRKPKSIYFELPAQHADTLKDWIASSFACEAIIKNDMQGKPRMMYISL